jgi:tyrosine-protein phosphatase YwqE
VTPCYHHKAEEGCPVCQHERERYDRIREAMERQADALELSALSQFVSSGLFEDTDGEQSRPFADLVETLARKIASRHTAQPQGEEGQ